jgi:hypothetical protein
VDKVNRATSINSAMCSRGLLDQNDRRPGAAIYLINMEWRGGALAAFEQPGEAADEDEDEDGARRRGAW